MFISPGLACNAVSLACFYPWVACNTWFPSQQEDTLAQQAFEDVRRRTRDFDDRDRSHREEMEGRRQDPGSGAGLGSGDEMKLR
ncbi:hypothetical protein FKM82_003562 [Ascaphus truei]